MLITCHKVAIFIIRVPRHLVKSVFTQRSMLDCMGGGGGGVDRQTDTKSDRLTDRYPWLVPSPYTIVQCPVSPSCVDRPPAPSVDSSPSPIFWHAGLYPDSIPVVSWFNILLSRELSRTSLDNSFPFYERHSHPVFHWAQLTGLCHHLHFRILLNFIKICKYVNSSGIRSELTYWNCSLDALKENAVKTFYSMFSWFKAI